MTVLRERRAIYTALINEVAHRFESQHHELVIKRVDFTHWWDVGNCLLKDFDVALKRTVSGDQ